MLNNQYDFFISESNKYEQILLDFKNNSKVFEDENFHPINNKIDEKKLKSQKTSIDLYNPKIVWRRVDEFFQAPLFSPSKIHPSYINQGLIGDCFFITALSRVAKKSELVQTLFEKQRPDKILGEVPDSINIKCGAVVIYFRVFGRRTPVLIDTRLPFSKEDDNTLTFLFSRLIDTDKSPWFLLVEKAFAKLNGSYSNIIGGFFSESIYSLYGYYNKKFNLTISSIDKNVIKILTYQKRGCLMDAAISTKDKDKIDAAKKIDLVDNHSYLLLKVRKYENHLFFKLRNPWGYQELKYIYSDDPTFSPELKEFIKNERGNGIFWIHSKDFFAHFNWINVAKPVDPHWTMRMFSFQVPPTNDKQSIYLDQHSNFAFQLIDDIPEGKKARVRILVEKRNTDYSKLNFDESKLYLYVGRNGGKKLIGNYISSNSQSTISISTEIKDKNDIVTFAIVHKTPEKIEANCYVNVFCEFDFNLYNIDMPGNLFEKGERRGAVTDNFSFAEPNEALILARTNIEGQVYLCLKQATVDDFKRAAQNELKVDDIIKNDILIKNLIKETTVSKIPGTQINKKKFIFNNDLVKQGIMSSIYRITDKEEAEERAAIISKSSVNFTEKVSIVMQLKYPSIINIIGFNETDFSRKPNPMIITDLYTQGTLASALEDYYNALDSTKKMINLIGIAFGMNYIHQHKIILRDLTCSSILLDDNLYPRIANFDSARKNVLDNEKFVKLPPFRFFAPEILHGEQYSFPADVFAYGMLFYHVVSNEVPTIKHNGEANFNYRISNGELPALNKKIPTRFHSFIKSMWNTDPDQRPTFEQIIEKFLHSRRECWLNDVNEDEVECYIHQFGATFKRRNQIENTEIIQKIKEKLPKDIFDSVKHLNSSTISSNMQTISDLACALYKNPPNEDALEISIELANIACDLNSLKTFALLGNAYKRGKGVKRNKAIAAFYYKVAADRDDMQSMFAYAKILTDFSTKKIGIKKRKRLLKEGRESIFILDGKNSYFYEEARICFDTIEDYEASRYVAKKYFEKASKKGHTKSTNMLKNLSNIDYPQPYFEELYKEITDEMINK